MAPLEEFGTSCQRVRNNSKNLKGSEDFGGAVKVWIKEMNSFGVLESRLEIEICEPLLCQFFETSSF